MDMMMELNALRAANAAAHRELSHLRRALEQAWARANALQTEVANLKRQLAGPPPPPPDGDWMKAMHAEGVSSSRNPAQRISRLW